MKIAIIGGGVCGLAAGYFLSQKGHTVSIFEKSDSLGGLSGSFKEKNWQWPLEKYYHHFFASDAEIFSLSKQLSIKEALFFKKPKTSVFVKGKIFRFDNLQSILAFPFLSLTDKFRTGIVSLFLKMSPFWKSLEKIKAETFIQKTMGENSYLLVWRPLLESKFQENAKEIPASWFWTRVKKRSFSLGYFKGGNQVLIDSLAKNIEKNGGEIFLNSPVKNLDDLNRKIKFDKTVAAVPAQTFLKIAPGLPEGYRKKIQGLKMTGCLNLILFLKEKFLKDGTYWLNINEAGFPFVAVVEHTNFIDPRCYGGNHLLYVGGYYPQNHRYFKMKKDDILEEFLPYLEKINPNFDFKLLTLNFELFTNIYAQPIPTLNYSQTILPSIRTPVPNLYWASLHHVYPQDRGVNYAIQLGKKIADEIKKN